MTAASAVPATAPPKGASPSKGAPEGADGDFAATLTDISTARTATAEGQSKTSDDHAASGQPQGKDACADDAQDGKDATTSATPDAQAVVLATATLTVPAPAPALAGSQTASAPAAASAQQVPSAPLTAAAGEQMTSASPAAAGEQGAPAAAQAASLAALGEQGAAASVAAAGQQTPPTAASAAVAAAAGHVASAAPQQPADAKPAADAAAQQPVAAPQQQPGAPAQPAEAPVATDAAPAVAAPAPQAGTTSDDQSATQQGPQQQAPQVTAPAAPPVAAEAAPHTTAAPQAPAQHTPRLALAGEHVHALLRIASHRGQAQAHLALKPAELGGVEVRLRVTTQGLVASIRADRPDSAQVLQQAGADLRKAFEAAGVDVASVDIGFAGDGAGSRANERQAENANGSRARNGAAQDDELPPIDPDTTTAATTTIALGALVDVLA